MKFACVIPARYKSSRFPGKLLALAKGKTVLQRTIEAAQKTSSLSLYVATDDKRIGDHAASLGVEPIYTSVSCPNGTSRIAEALEKHRELQKADLIVNLQGDHPLTEPETLEALVRSIGEDLVATPIVPIEEESDYLSPHRVKCVFDDNGHALYFSRSPIPYRKAGEKLKAWGHIGVYAYRAEFFKKTWQKSWLCDAEDLEQLAILEAGVKIRVVPVKEPVFGVDTPNDLTRLEAML
jgi:3-deoxy-manno-octulosonate cytidylyltransferase (CMP-KDO synthetase)